MDELIEFIVSELEIPYITENNAVMDGCFCLSPYYSEALIGDGCVASVVNYYTVDIFYEDKKLAVLQAIKLWKALTSNVKYCSESPDYTFESGAGMWHASIRAQEVLNE